MNSCVYIFGELSSGYTQYPEDSSMNELKKIYPYCKATTQIAIHRDASMMFYCYIRKLNDNKYLGLCIAVNGYYIARVDDLFSLFENTIEKIAQQGSFIHFAKDGSLTTSTTVLKEEEEEIDTLSENLRRNFEVLGSSTNTLPQVDYTVAKNSVKEFSVLDDKWDVVRASYTYGYTIIYKDQDYDTIRVNSYRSILAQLNEENNSLKKTNEELKGQNTKVLRQKKQIRNVIILTLAVFALILGLLVLNGSLENTKYELSNARKKLYETNEALSQTKNKLSNSQKELSKVKTQVSELNDQLEEKDEEISNMKDSLDLIKEKVEEMEENLSSFRSKFYSVMPIIINSVSVANVYGDDSFETGYGSSIHSENTMYLKPRITYTGLLSNKDITLYIRLYGPSGLSTGNNSPSGYSQKYTISVNSGENTVSLRGFGGEKKGHWAKGTYRYEFWYDNVCLKAKTFTIY